MDAYLLACYDPIMLGNQEIYERAQKHIVSGRGYDPAFETELERLLHEDEDEENEIELIMSDGDDILRLPTELTEVSPSEFTSFAIKIPSKGRIESFNFEDRPYLPSIYDTRRRRVLQKCARQTEKSTGLGNVSIAYSVLNMGFKVLYVTATAQQATVFSVDRIREPIEISPIIASMTTTKLAQNILFKQFRNRSQIRIRYAFLSADRTRGISADLILIDEIQDILVQNIPVIEQCASHSMWKLFRYSGTPKSNDNTIQVYWDRFSTQNEWVVPCDRHTPRHWNILGERNIGKKGVVCAKCKKPIDPLSGDARWVSMQPVTEDNGDVVAFDGFRISQLMVPWIIRDPSVWSDSVLLPYNSYERAKFYNEVLGLSYDSGSRPLTRVQLMGCCRDELRMDEVEENARKCEGGVFVGIDWGLGERDSYTLLVLGGYIDGVFTIFFGHRFTGSEVESPVQLEMIAKLLTNVDFTLAGCDYGIGFDRNDWLARVFGPERIKKFQYIGRAKRKVKWEPGLNRFVVYKTEVVSDVLNAIKRGPDVIRFPRWDQWKDPCGEDMLNVFSEYSENTRMLLYKVSPGKSDDTLHAVTYCLLASMIVMPRPDILIPVQYGTEQDYLNY